MARVCDVWFMRKVRSALLVRCVAIGVVALIGGFYVSYDAIFTNLIHVRVGALDTYFLDAIGKTKWVVKALLGLAGLLSVMLLWDVGRFIGLLMSRTVLARHGALSRSAESSK